MALAQAAGNHWDDEGWPDIYNEEYLHQFQPEPTYKVH